MEGFQCIAYVSGLEISVARYPDAVIHSQQNRAMRKLYDFGCRRIVAPKRLPPTGDGERYLVRGFIE